MDYLLDLLSSVPNEIIVLLISMIPVIELRGALPVAVVAFNMPWLEALLLCVVGNLLPVPFIIWFLRPIFEWMKKTKLLRGLVIRLENRAKKKAEAANAKEDARKRNSRKNAVSFWALFAFVAIPLPGTGAWTGALIASVMGMRLKHSFPAVALGVVTAGLIMLALSHLGLMAFA